MNTTLFSFTKPLPTFPTQFPMKPTQPHRLRLLGAGPLNSSGDGTATSREDDQVDAQSPLPSPTDAAPIRYKRVSRRRARQQEESERANAVAAKQPKPKVRKEWEAMTLSEKALELYVGEKGLLFWINKFAYASIFIIIGAWILFRFVGPALNLYQLDGPPLSPSDVLKGS